MENTFNIKEGLSIEGRSFSPTRETIWEFCEASLDYNPLHWDDEYMKSNFGKTNFGGIIMHGMSNFSLISRMMTDWALPLGGTHRRLETRWKSPVKPGDTITPTGVVKKIKKTDKANWVVISVQVKNQEDTLVAEGEAMVEFLD
ncbi:MaoC family dehydratase [Allopusillimonas ginsengisoli]|uniref:MaoC family dehydratase n=1 Tax=Allopusillimonas ginsengisoli TaxID=453575 RepID=UPI0010C214F2|nr:phosphate acetyltransferase [Allopusillimonas ginsengisoli]